MVICINREVDCSRLNGAFASPCYRLDGQNKPILDKPQKCNPPFENVAAEKLVLVSPENMTCGIKNPSDYCIQTHGIYRECDRCDATSEEKAHKPEYLTDIHTESNPTWWQSTTMLENVHTQELKLTANLGKAYDITYVRLKFQSPRPADFAIYKKNRPNPSEPDLEDENSRPWIPWQYYSLTCRDQYNAEIRTSIDSGRKQRRQDQPFCTDEFSDMTPLSGGNVAFSTLDGREAAFDFENSPELQEWVTATDIQIRLKNLNTFGDEVFGDENVLRSYYYAITDFTVGGRCKCNGHANNCSMVPINETVIATASDGTQEIKINAGGERMECRCEHGTDGPNCEMCLPDHNSRPWRRATQEDAHECRPCECNGWSGRCRYVEDLYTQTGDGGECLDCDGNRAGQHCEICKENHYLAKQPDAQGRIPCVDCACDNTGSLIQQCNPEDGQCPCKPGVTGQYCERCDETHWDFGLAGCKDCQCRPDGSLNNTARCDAATGNCFCKQNVEGQKCDRCKSGHFYIDEENEFGCTPCFCYGHTQECDRNQGYGRYTIRSDFSRGDESWKSFEGEQECTDDCLPVKADGINKNIGVQDVSGAPSGVYFLAPDKFLGDQKASYGQTLKFKLRVGEAGVIPRQDDLVIMSGGNRPIKISLSLTDQDNPIPNLSMQDYTFRLHEHPKFKWSPSLSAKDFMAVLANITAIKIRGTYVPNGAGFLDEVKLESARRGIATGQATWIERCVCPEGYKGNFCEKCIPGYYHENNGGPFARCIPCSCNSHTEFCDSETGKCECNHNTDGHNCEKCARGYYGNALNGTEYDCKQCPCPEGSPCHLVPTQPESDENPVCTECPEGRRGPRCEECEDGYFGDPEGRRGNGIRPCQKCNCNNNVDPGAIGNCDTNTGECLRCIDHTDGFNCERCAQGFFGDALAIKRPGDPPSCQPCQCYPLGTNIDDQTQLPICNGLTGDCSCKHNVAGRDCDRCEDGYFDITSADGCAPCNCDAIGSINATCNVVTGQCNCHVGVDGLQCEECKPLHYGFSPTGCSPCDCDPTGSLNMQCDLLTGKCDCYEKIEGRRCDRCEENTRSKPDQQGQKICEPCDDCYNLVRDAANNHRRSLEDLDQLLEKIGNDPEPLDNRFEMRLRQLQQTVTATLAEAKIEAKPQGNQGTLRDRLDDLDKKLQDVTELVSASNDQIQKAKMEGREADGKARNAKQVIYDARTALKAAKDLLNNQGRDALRKAEERSRKFGEESEKMSSIAREARQLAEQQEEDANEIASIAKQALDTSNNAYDMAYDALNQQTDTSKQVNVLVVQVQDMSTKLRSVQSLATQTLKDSTDSYNLALNIYQQALAMQVPTVDNRDLEDKARKVEAEAKQIAADANLLLENNNQLLADMQNRRIQLEDLLNRAQTQQQQVDQQMETMTEYKSKADNAVTTGNAVLQDAEQTLKTLQDFDQTFLDSKTKAEEALRTVDDIDEMVRIAYAKTQEAMTAMQGADTSANLALTVALNAETISKEASEVAETVSVEATESRQLSKELSDAASSLTNKLSETKDRLGEKEGVAASDGASALTALEKANQAQNKAREASKKVNEAKKELDDIAAILLTVQEPEPGLLEELARRVEAAEAKFESANLDLRLTELEAAKKRQAEQVRDMERQLEFAKEEAANIEEIRNTLPTVCLKQPDDNCLENDC